MGKKKTVLAVLITALFLFLTKSFFMRPDFDWKVFVILSVLGFLFFYKMTQYLEVFKIRDKNSRIDIVFVCIFFILLFIPTLKIDTSEYSFKENRKLNVWPTLFNGNKINTLYGREFEEALNDRFLGRRILIRRFNHFKYKMCFSNETERAYMGKDNWLFTKLYDSPDRIRNTTLYTAEELNKIQQNLERFNSWATQNGVQVYVQLNPDKESIYPEMLPKFKKVNSISKREQLEQNLRDFGNVHFAFSYTDLMDAKKDGLIFCKAGTHETRFGKMIMYHNLISKMSEQFPKLKPIDEKDVVFGDTIDCDKDIFNVMFLKEKEYGQENLTDTLISLKKPAKSDFTYEERFTNSEHFVDYITHFKREKPKTGLRVFMFTDSISNQYRDWMPEHFDEGLVVFLGNGRTFDIPMYAKDIAEFKPNVFIIASVERFYHRLLYIDPPTKIKE